MVVCRQLSDVMLEAVDEVETDQEADTAEVAERSQCWKPSLKNGND